jgi:hypothetical protein
VDAASAGGEVLKGRRLIMETRSGWANFLCIVLAVALVGSWLRPSGQAVTVVYEPVDTTALHDLELYGFTDAQVRSILKELLPKLTLRCTEVVNDAGLRNLPQIMRENGLVFIHSRYLYQYDAATLDLVYEETQFLYMAEFSTGRAQAGTVPAVRYGRRLTTNGKHIIFLHDSAFLGESFIFGRLSLGEVIGHELIHAGGQPRTPGRLGFLDHDLAGFEDYGKIMDGCN